MTRVCRNAIAVWLLSVVALASGVLASQTSGPVQYVYDELGRLTGVIDANGNAAVYNYDAVGNILSIGRYSSTQVSVISFTPGQGPQGASVTIYGTGFSTTAAQNTVQFNGVAAVVTSATSNQLVTTVPTGASTGPISVTSPVGNATSGSAFAVTAGSGPPTITSFSPLIALPGNSLTIAGTNFSATTLDNRVLFNSLGLGNVTSATTTSVAATIPTIGGSGRIAIATPGGTAVSSSDFFKPFNSHVVADVAYTGRMTIGTTQNVSIPANKIGILVFDATAGQHATVALSGSTFSSPMLYLLRPDGSVLTQNSAGIASTDLPVTGTYSIGIETSSGGSAGVELFSDVTGTIVIDGSPLTIATTIPGQDARVSFSAGPGQQVVLTVTNVTNPQANIALLGPTGELQFSYLTITNTPNQIFFLDQQTLSAPGSYTFWILHTGTDVGSETLQLNSAPDFISSITPGGPAVRVPASGDTIIGQNGHLTFAGNSGQKVSMTVSGSTYAQGSCLLSLKDPTGAVVTSGLVCYGTSNVFVDSTALTSTGTYTIFVDPQGRATGHATVQLYDCSDVTGTINIDGSSVTTGTTVQGQDTRLTFSATAGQRVVLQVTNVTNPSATLYLLKPDGTTQTSFAINNNPSGQLFFMDTQTLATTGTYTLLIKHSSTNVGSETLQLNSVPADYTSSLTSGVAAQVPPSGNLAIGQNASLTFAGNAGSEVSLQFSDSTMGQATVSLLKPDGTTLVTTTTSAAAFGMTTMLPTTGTYTVFINPAGTSSGSVSVLLTVVGGSGPPSRTATTIDPSNPLSQNLVGLFVMNESTGTTDKNLVDGQTASFAGTNMPTWNTSDPSVVFNGTTTSLSSYLDAGTDLSFDQMPNNQMTVVAKVFLNSLQAGGFAEKTDSSSCGFEFGMDANGGLVGEVQNGTYVHTTAGAVASGQWVQVAFTWDGTVNTTAVAHLYVNGVLQTIKDSQNGTAPGYSCATNKSFRIGNASNLLFSGAHSFNGKIAYVAVYKYRILSATELGQLDARLPITTDVVGSMTESAGPTTVTTTAVGQNAHVKFQGWANQQVTVQLSNNTMGAVNVSLIAPNGSAVTTASSSSTSFALSQVALPSTGVFDVLVQPTGGTTGSITVSLQAPDGRAVGSTIDSSNPLSQNLVGLFVMNEGTGTTDKNLVDGQTASFAGTNMPTWNTSDPSVALAGTTTSLSSYLDAGTDLSFDQMPNSQMTVVAKVFLNSLQAGGFAEKTDSSSCGFEFGMDANGGLVGEVLSSTSMYVHTTAGAVASGQWVQVAFTWDGTVNTTAVAHLYVNGVLQTIKDSQNGSAPGYSCATNKSFRIGNTSNLFYSGGSSLDGKIAYVAVYKGRILSSTDLNQLDTQLPIH